VHKAAQKTDAKQENRNILLSDDALVDSKPQLEIYADDVKCTHGATIGQLEADAIFYLRSRGIPENEARAILLLGFAGECLERIRDDAVRAYVDGLVRERIPRGHVIEGAA
jgi:Fe-S cluster assembly protein SufD